MQKMSKNTVNVKTVRYGTVLKISNRTPDTCTLELQDITRHLLESRVTDPDPH